MFDRQAEMYFFHGAGVYHDGTLRACEKNLRTGKERIEKTKVHVDLPLVLISRQALQ